MKVVQDNRGPVLQRCNEVDHDKLACADSVSSLPSAESTDASSISDWEHDRHSKRQARAAGRAILRRMKQFESSSSLSAVASRRVAELHWNELEIGPVLGSGGFSSVHLASIYPDNKEPHQETSDCDLTSSHSHAPLCHRKFALKFLDKKVRERGTDSVSQAAADLAFEAKILSCLNHKNIIQLHGTSGDCLLDSFEDKRGFFLVLDLLEDTLFDRIQRWSHKEGHSTNVLNRLKTAAVGISRGMEYLHKNNIVFRDLKPQNIGFCRATGDVKIFDFGLAAEINMGERLNSTVGTPRYMAPEVMMGQTYGMSCDVYSFGIVLWQICSLRRPFSKKFKDRDDLFAHVAVQDRRPSTRSLLCPASVKNMMKECWHPDPTRRPTFKAIRRRLDRVLTANEP